jgi:YD repeat-containing protein
MTRTLLLILGLLIAVTVPCQSKKERKENRIKSTTEWETAIVDGKSTTYKVMYEEFDKAGRPVMKVEYAPDGAVTCRSTVIFNSFGNKTEETEFDLAKKKNLRWTYRYNALKDKTEEVEYEGSGAIRKKTTFTYDARGNRITETETDAAGNLLQKAVFTYNQKNLKTGKTIITGSKLKDKSKKWDYVCY